MHVGSLMELVETGRSECQSQGMAAFLRPLISRGELQVVAECCVVSTETAAGVGDAVGTDVCSIRFLQRQMLPVECFRMPLQPIRTCFRPW